MAAIRDIFFHQTLRTVCLFNLFMTWLVNELNQGSCLSLFHPTIHLKHNLSLPPCFPIPTNAKMHSLQNQNEGERNSLSIYGLLTRSYNRLLYRRCSNDSSHSQKKRKRSKKNANDFTNICQSLCQMVSTVPLVNVQFFGNIIITSAFFPTHLIDFLYVVSGILSTASFISKLSSSASKLSSGAKQMLFSSFQHSFIMCFLIFTNNQFMPDILKDLISGRFK